MFIDQASYHKSKGLKIPPNIELAYLPPCSPEWVTGVVGCARPEQALAWSTANKQVTKSSQRQRKVGNRRTAEFCKKLELNPQEQVWDELKEKFFGNKLFKSIESVIDRIVEGLRCLESSPLTPKNLTQKSWMKI